jgi:hypothetical protein
MVLILEKPIIPSIRVKGPNLKCIVIVEGPKIYFYFLNYKFITTQCTTLPFSEHARAHMQF